MPERPRLAVLMDGSPLPEEEARELWTKFSQHMDENQGDMAGFARQSGWVSVSPEYRKGQAVLVVRTTESAPVSPPPEASPRPARRPKSSVRRRKR